MPFGGKDYLKSFKFSNQNSCQQRVLLPLIHNANIDWQAQ